MSDYLRRKHQRFVDEVLFGKLYHKNTRIGHMILDFSEGGLGVICAKELSVGEEMTLSHQNKNYKFIVRWQRKLASSVYRVGLQIGSSVQEDWTTLVKQLLKNKDIKDILKVG